jgi:hypothetical protein
VQLVDRAGDRRGAAVCSGQIDREAGPGSPRRELLVPRSTQPLVAGVGALTALPPLDDRLALDLELAESRLAAVTFAAADAVMPAGSACLGADHPACDLTAEAQSSDVSGSRSRKP